MQELSDVFGTKYTDLSKSTEIAISLTRQQPGFVPAPDQDAAGMFRCRRAQEYRFWWRHAQMTPETRPWAIQYTKGGYGYFRKTL